MYILEQNNSSRFVNKLRPSSLIYSRKAIKKRFAQLYLDDYQINQFNRIGSIADNYGRKLHMRYRPAGSDIQNTGTTQGCRCIGTQVLRDSSTIWSASDIGLCSTSARPRPKRIHRDFRERCIKLVLLSAALTRQKNSQS